jgi:transposase
MDRDSLTTLLARGLSVEKIAQRFGKHPSTVSYWMTKYGLEAPNREKHAAKGGIGESQLEALVKQGMSITELALELDRSKATVRHWLKKHGLQTLHTRRRKQRRQAVQDADALSADPVQRLTMTCRLHGETDFVREGRGYYRCGRCRSDSVASHRRRLKALLIDEAGGKCILCGYDREPRALEFHHVDPTQKAFNLSRKGITLSVQTLRAEARKCVLLCSNCHAEVEGGFVVLPDTILGRSTESSKTLRTEVSIYLNPG